MSDCNLVVGDCVEELNKLPDNCADLVFVDPPFNIGKPYPDYSDRLGDHEYLDWCRKWISESFRILKQSGSFWLASGDEYVAELKCLCSQTGFVMRNWVIWYYSFGQHCSKKFSRSHTHLLYLVKCPESAKFNADAVRVPSSRQMIYNDRRAKHSGRVPDDVWVLRPQDYSEYMKPFEDVWYFSRVCGTFRERSGAVPCQMPVALLERIILSCTDAGDLVVDPCMGSGTTAVAAVKNGRRFFGVDISQSAVSAALDRLSKI